MKNTTLKFAFYIITLSLILSTYCFTQEKSKAIKGPDGTNNFGTNVATLPNGNIVITDPSYETAAGAKKVGAVYLYDGKTNQLISRLTGSSENDQVGIGGITVLTNGNFVVSSPNWSNGGFTRRGAVTLGNMRTGIAGFVSQSNSLVGATNNDSVGSGKLVALTNGNYVVNTINFDNGGVIETGAVTWGDGETGAIGIVSSSNSLVGTSPYDYIGLQGIVALPNGNYVVRSANWDHNGLQRVGAVTWGNGRTGISGAITPANSLVGSQQFDYVGTSGITVLANGNYVVGSHEWNNRALENAGAVTLANGTTGLNGAVSASNSLIGSAAFQYLSRVTALTNGNYVVHSSAWSNDQAQAVGAVVWSSGTNGVTGTISESNAMVGSSTQDGVGSEVVALPNGNYVVMSPRWDNGQIQNVGAATWGDGSNGTTGTVSTSNSLTGASENDQIGYKGRSFWGTSFSGAVALTNDNYVVTSPFWDNGQVQNVGAVTLVDGTQAFSGTVSTSNSLIGSKANDYVGFSATYALTNGNYVVSSNLWDSGDVENAGAVTFRDGTQSLGEIVSSSNSLVGTQQNDQVGNEGVTSLNNGNYVVKSGNWNSGNIQRAGAITWGNGRNGITGEVSASNSLIGSSPSDFSRVRVIPLSNGNYSAYSSRWRNPAGLYVGAIAYMNGHSSDTGNLGAASTKNSVRGTVQGGRFNSSLDTQTNMLIVGIPNENRVIIFSRFNPPPKSAEISGHIMTANGKEISGAIVTLTDKDGQIRTVRTNEKGFYSIAHIETGFSYGLSVSAPRHTFESFSVMVKEDKKGADITANR